MSVNCSSRCSSFLHITIALVILSLGSNRLAKISCLMESVQNSFKNVSSSSAFDKLVNRECRLGLVAGMYWFLCILWIESCVMGLWSLNQ